ncbi:hypothetical protein [Pseudomonas silensiensis]|uniref:hypothetical protein n=1 Tax=Pseudomonas silensiensis TaxID=2991049 RepID=UPI003D1F05C8
MTTGRNRPEADAHSISGQGPRHRAPNLAASFNIGLFNLGNAIGAWLDGWVIAQGFGYASPNWAGGLLSTAALVLALASGWLTVSRVANR